MIASWYMLRTYVGREIAGNSPSSRPTMQSNAQCAGIEYCIRKGSSIPKSPFSTKPYEPSKE